MTKRQLMKKLDELVDAVNSLNKQLSDAKRENEELKLAISLLGENKSEEKNEEAKGFTVNTEIECTNEEPKEEIKVPAENVVLSDDIMEYGSQIIGKIVIESVKYANAISASENENKKELLNLIMGKAEIAKAEIFSISSGNGDALTKKEQIDAQLDETLDYFKSVAAQI